MFKVKDQQVDPNLNVNTNQRFEDEIKKLKEVIHYDSAFTKHGMLHSTHTLSKEAKFDINQYFQISEKAKVALTACSLWRLPGDYFEFGSADLCTFRNFLSAYDIFNLDSRFPDTEFYAFDIFGKAENDEAALNKALEEAHKELSGLQKADYIEYLKHFKHNGDQYERNLTLLKQHGLYVDRSHLIQGYFEHTLSPEFKAELKNRNRKISFAFLDCNVQAPYKVVFEFIFDLIADQSYIYLDEYYAPSVDVYFDQFKKALYEKRGLNTRFIRNAGGFGALFYICPDHSKNIPPLKV